MAREKRKIPMASLERVLKQATANYNINRTSNKAVEKLKEIIEDAVKNITVKAMQLATFKNAATITDEEVKMAAKQLYPRLKI